MAGEVELERLVVRLIGDGSSFQKMMTDAVATTRTMTNRMYTAISRAERFAGTLIKGLGSFGLASSLRGMFGQFADLEQGQIRLNAAIRGGGHDAEVLVRQYTRIAEQIASTTLNTKGYVLSLFQQAEANQLSGQAAEDAVKYAIALAGATGQSADAMMRTAIQLQRGHPEFAKRVLNLRDVKNGTELLTKIQEKMNTGMAIATAQFNSANGRMERLGRAFKGMGQDIGGMIAKVLLPIVGVIQQVFDAFKKLEPAQKQQIALVLGMTVAWLGMGPVTQVLKDLLAPTLHLLRFLVISLPLTVANALAWIAWKTILGLAAIVVYTLAAAIWLTNTAQLVSKIQTLAISAAMLIWKGAIWLVNAALTVMNVLLSPLALLAIVGVVVTLGVAFFTLYAAISSIVTVFRNFTGLAGPLGAITGMLGDWWTKIREIFRTAQSDMPRAWEMLKAGFALAISQVRDLWPPLWLYVQRGWGVIWDAIAGLFISKMQEAAVVVMRLTIGMIPGMQARIDAIVPQGANKIIDRMQARLGALSQAFRVPESDATRAARAVYDGLRPIGAAAGGAEIRLNTLRDAMKDVRQEAQRFDAALHGSVEALARIAEYKDRIAVGRVNPSPVLNAAAVGQLSAASASVTGLGGNAALPVLNSILLAIQNATILRVQPAALGNP